MDTGISNTSNAPPQPSHTTLYVLIPPSPLFAAHWSLFIPDLDTTYDAKTKRFNEFSTGRRIHVSGDRLHGFALEIVRGYDFRRHRGVDAARRFAIGVVPTRFLTSAASATAGEQRDAAGSRKDEDEGGGAVDNRPLDDFEEVCLQVEAPGPSLRRVGEACSGDQTAIVNEGKRIHLKGEVRDCQWWVRQVVDKLVEKGVLEPLPMRSESEMKRPLEVVLNLPVH